MPVDPPGGRSWHPAPEDLTIAGKGPPLPGAFTALGASLARSVGWAQLCESPFSRSGGSGQWSPSHGCTARALDVNQPDSPRPLPPAAWLGGALPRGAVWAATQKGVPVWRVTKPQTAPQGRRHTVAETRFSPEEESPWTAFALLAGHRPSQQTSEHLHVPGGAVDRTRPGAVRCAPGREEQAPRQ